ncbi:MAG: hypothetical protein M0Q12_00075 [Synergistaceae bacterium]|nr:hypothetical protein [Synergistaceae bacterium]
MVEFRPLDKPGGKEIGEGYTGSMNDMAEAASDYFSGGEGANGSKVIVLDCSLEEAHSSEADITLHPIEDGSEITDHIKKIRDGLSIRGLISDSPMQSIVETVLTGGFDVGSITTIGGNAPPSKEAWESLKTMQENGTIFNIITGLEKYRNMAIKTISTTKTKDVGEAIIVEIEFQKARVIDTSGQSMDGTDEEPDYGPLGAIGEIDPVLLSQALVFIATMTWAYVEAYT